MRLARFDPIYLGLGPVAALGSVGKARRIPVGDWRSRSCVDRAKDNNSPRIPSPRSARGLVGVTVAGATSDGYSTSPAARSGRGEARWPPPG